MQLRVQVSPRAFKAGEHERIDAQLAAGTCPRCPGKWRVLSRIEGPAMGMLRAYIFELEPLDAAARATAANQML